jgi:hypothetical protein
MAKRKTPVAPGIASDPMQPIVTPVASASGNDAGPRHRKHSVPRQRPPGAPPQTLRTDTAPTTLPPASEAAHGPGNPASVVAETTLTLRVSTSLLRQLEAKAQDEGVSLSVLATEFLAEGLVLRAWEILQRQAARRGGPGMMRPHAAPGAHGTHPGGRGHNHRRDHGNRRQPQRRGGNVMDDQATFLEYVRTQERKRR